MLLCFLKASVSISSIRVLPRCYSLQACHADVGPGGFYPKGSALGASMMLYPAISTISTWFAKRRALALGLTSTGRLAFEHFVAMSSSESEPDC